MLVPVAAPVDGRRRNAHSMATRGYGSIVDVGSALLGLTPAGETHRLQTPQGEAFKELWPVTKSPKAASYAYPIPAGNPESTSRTRIA